MSKYNQLLSLFTALDSEPGLEGKINLTLRWLEIIPEIKEARYIQYENLHEKEKDIYRITTPQVLKDPQTSKYFEEEEEKWRKGALYFPIHNSEDAPFGVFLLRCKNPMSLLKEKGDFLSVIGSKLRDIHIINNNTNCEGLNGKQVQKAIYEEENRYLFDLLNLPLYLCHLSGRFAFVNKAFLKKYGYKDMNELNAQGDFFEGNLRAEETVKLAKYGRTSGFNLRVKHKFGSYYTVRDFATLRDGYILGVLFDVTDFVELNREMKEALEVQELLNDKIMSSALILQKTQTTAIRTLARLAEFRDQTTGEHLERICEYTKILVYEVYKRQPYDYKINEQYVNDLVLSSMLHDIGKVAVPDSILRKKNNLTSEEWKVIKQHTEWGYELLSKADQELGEQSFLTLASQIALNHHEHWDGQGYPRGIQGADIPLSARIEALADVYDALTSTRPYKGSWTHQDTVDYISERRGKQFDPILVDIFLESQEKFFHVYKKFQERIN